jgi:glutamyl-tRNA reductase
LSIPKNVNKDVEELEGVTLIHMDYLSQLTDETLENRKAHIPAAEVKRIKESLMFGPKVESLPTITAKENLMR